MRVMTKLIRIFSKRERIFFVSEEFLVKKGFVDENIVLLGLNRRYFLYKT